MHDLAGDVGRGLEEQHGVNHVADLAGPPERRQLVTEAVVGLRRVLRGPDDAGGDGVDPDAARGVLDGQQPGRRGQAALGQRSQCGGRGGVRDLGDGRRDARPVYISAPSNWELPPLSLLQRTRDQKLDRSLTEAAGEELVDALAAHGVETTLVGYTVGPTVTRFELELGPGVKVSRVTSLNKDIAYAMASPDVRILAPIPGRSAIGVEVPNRQRSLVALGDLLTSEESLAAHPPARRADRARHLGQTVVVNLGEMPHVLISGATGAGKSSAMNSLITALVMRATPDQLRLLLIDPKRVEMGQYNDLPHLLVAGRRRPEEGGRRAALGRQGDGAPLRPSR